MNLDDLERQLDKQNYRCARPHPDDGSGHLKPGDRLALAHDGAGLVHLGCAQVASIELAGASTVNGVDLHSWGPNANPDPANVGVPITITLHLGEDNALALDLTAGRGGCEGHRILIPGDELRQALADTGITWVQAHDTPQREHLHDAITDAINLLDQGKPALAYGRLTGSIHTVLNGARA